MHTIKSKIKMQTKTKKIMLIIAIMLLLICIISGTLQITRQIRKKQLENKPLLEYDIKDKIDSKNYQIVVKVNNKDGIESVKYTNSKIIIESTKTIKVQIVILFLLNNFISCLL